jgi:cytosine/adenosine deaminase-related metal-dependent hydrolase
LSQEQPFGDGRVQLGLAWDSWYLPKEVVSKIFEQARGWGIKLITTHHNRSPTLGKAVECISLTPGFMSVQPLVEWNLLGSDVLFSHCVNATAEEAAQINQFGAHVSSTPSTEIQMALGDPVCFRTDLSKVSSLGVDCHSAAAADIPGQMRLALQYARGTRNRRILESGKTPRSIEYTVEQVFNLGTIQGARAVGKESEIGSLAEGKLADLVIYDPQSPGMVCASALDPVAAIVLHSSVRDIDTVFVDGVIRKQGGKLSPVDVDSKKMDWKEIASKLIESYHKIQEEVEKCDHDKALKTICSTFMLSDSMYSD